MWRERSTASGVIREPDGDTRYVTYENGEEVRRSGRRQCQAGSATAGGGPCQVPGYPNPPGGVANLGFSWCPGERRAAGPRLCLAGGWSTVCDSDGQCFDARTDRGEAAGGQPRPATSWRPWARATASARRACGSETAHCRLPGNISTKLGAPSSQTKMQTNRISNLRDQFDRGPR